MENACDIPLEPNIKMQKKYIGTITFSRYFDQIEPLFKELEILSSKKLFIQRALLMIFKYLFGVVPKPITWLLTRNDNIHHHNTIHSNLLHPIIGRTEATYKTFRSQAILIWNHISKEIAIKATITCFKKASLKYQQTHFDP